MQSSVHGNLGCFHTLALVNGAATNMVLEVSLRGLIFSLGGYMPTSGIPGSYHWDIFDEFLDCFLSGRTIVYFYL